MTSDSRSLTMKSAGLTNESVQALAKKNVHKEAPTTEEISAYAAPMLATSFLYTPLWVILPAVYAKYYGLELSSIALVILCARCFDGVTDIVIGSLADRHRNRGGSPKLWVVTGGIGVIVASYFLFSPPTPVTQSYYLVWTLAFFLAFTVIEIPHLGWGSSLTVNYNTRAKVFNIRALFFALGVSAFYAVPMLPFFEGTEFTPAMLDKSVHIGAALMVVFLLWSLFRAPVYTAGNKKIDINKSSFKYLLRNKPLLIYFLTVSCLTLSTGMFFGLLYFYIDSFLGLGASLAMILFSVGIIGAVCLPLWQKVVEKTSKAAAWAFGMALYCLTLVTLVFITNSGSWWIALIVLLPAHLGFACQNATGHAILSDVVDYGKLKFGVDQSSTCFAVHHLVFKFSLGAGSALALTVAGFFGFDPTAQTQDELSLIGLQVGFVYIPLLLAIIGIVLVLKTPITKKRHEIIRRRLSVRTLSIDTGVKS